MNKKNVSTPVVVLKTEHYGGLGIMRSLGRLGVKVYGIDASEHSPALHSRYCTERFIWDIEAHTAEESLAFLRSVVFRTGPFPVLIPTSDETMLFVAEHAETLRQWYTFSMLSEEIIRSLYNKKEMFALARQSNIPVPQTIFPFSLDDVFRFSKTATYPLMVKGIDGKELEKKTGKKMVIVRNADELVEKYLLMEDPENRNVMIQEYIPGEESDTWIFNGCFDKSTVPLLAFTGKKIRQNPVYTGMTSLGVAQFNEDVIRLSVKFMQSIGYRGVVDIDFRYDFRDGTYKILDVNPRVGATFRLFVGTNGMDVVRALYLNLTHQYVEPTDLQELRTWIVEDKDLLSSYRYMRDGALSFWEWISSVKKVDEAGYFSLTDITPFLMVWRNHLRRRTGKFFIKNDPPTAEQRKTPEAVAQQKPMEHEKISSDVAQESM